MSKTGIFLFASGALLTATLYAVLWDSPSGANSEYESIRGLCLLSVVSLSGALWVLWGARRMSISICAPSEIQSARIAALRRDRVFNYGFGVIVLGFCAFCAAASFVSCVRQESVTGSASATADWESHVMMLSGYLAWVVSMFGGALIAWKSRWRVLGLQAGGAALLAGEVACARFPVTDRAFRARLSRKYAALGVSLVFSLFLGSILTPMISGAGLYLLIWLPGCLLLWLFRRSLFIERDSGAVLDICLCAWPLFAWGLWIMVIEALR